ncbi:MAG: hypothetical protein U0610_10170 [bacterium]
MRVKVRLTSLTGWQRIYVVLSAVWLIFVSGQVVSELTTSSFARDFHDGCDSQSHLYFRWFDSKTHRRLSLWRDGEFSVNCAVLQQRADQMTSEARAGTIEPYMKLRGDVLILALIVPAMVLLLVIA